MRRLLGGLGQHFLRLEALARRDAPRCPGTFSVIARIVAEGQAGRDRAARSAARCGRPLPCASMMMLLTPSRSMIAHHLLLRAGGDREHRHHRAHAEDHAEHGQQAAQLVHQEARKPHLKFGKNAGKYRHMENAPPILAFRPCPSAWRARAFAIAVLLLVRRLGRRDPAARSLRPASAPANTMTDSLRFEQLDDARLRTCRSLLYVDDALPSVQKYRLGRNVDRVRESSRR